MPRVSGIFIERKSDGRRAASGFKIRLDPPDFHFFEEQRAQDRYPQPNQKVAEVAQHSADKPQIAREKRAQTCVESEDPSYAHQIARDALPGAEIALVNAPARPQLGETAQHAEPHSACRQGAVQRERVRFPGAGSPVRGHLPVSGKRDNYGGDADDEERTEERQ